MITPEQQIRIDMQPLWKEIQSKFIMLCGGDPHVMLERRELRNQMEAPLVEEYHRRVAALEKNK